VTLAAALLALYWLSLLTRALSRPEPLPRLPPAAGKGGPKASILVAVRNEMDRILEPSIESLLAQHYTDFEVLAVDDHSEDGSRNLLRAMAERNPRLRVLEAAEGAQGKRAALAQGARAAKGDWLLFTDADVLLGPDALARGIEFALGEEIDSLSLLPKTVAVSFWEQAALAATAWVVYEGRTLSRCNDDNAPVGLAAAGPYLLVRRPAFESLGGYDRIPQNVLLDVALARRLRESGFRYRYLASGGAVEARMYRSLAEIWRGFGKNAFVAAGGRLSTLLCAVPIYLFLVAVPLPLGLSLAFAGDLLGAALSLVAVATMASVQIRSARFMGTALKALPILLTPLAGLLWCAIALHSAAATLSSRGVFWKGRHLPAVEP
jgi:chlorobactene glucosyltransferase